MFDSVPPAEFHPTLTFALDLTPVLPGAVAFVDGLLAGETSAGSQVGIGALAGPVLPSDRVSEDGLVTDVVSGTVAVGWPSGPGRPSARRGAPG